MDSKEKRKQYYIDNRDRILERNKKYYHELPPSGVSRAVFGARHDSHQEDIVFMLLRGVGPHSHPRTESSGVVWGRPSPPALGS